MLPQHQNKKAPRHTARGFSVLLQTPPELGAGGPILSRRRPGLQGVEQVSGLSDGVFFQQLPEDVGQDAAVEVAV